MNVTQLSCFQWASDYLFFSGTLGMYCTTVVNEARPGGLCFASDESHREQLSLCHVWAESSPESAVVRNVTQLWGFCRVTSPWVGSGPGTAALWDDTRVCVPTDLSPHVIYTLDAVSFRVSLVDSPHPLHCFPLTPHQNRSFIIKKQCCGARLKCTIPVSFSCPADRCTYLDQYVISFKDGYFYELCAG